MNAKTAYFKQNLKQHFYNPLFYISALIFFVYICWNFFIKQSFFSSSGTTDLLLYFSKVPYISILIIPVLCFKQNFENYDSFLPLSRLNQILLKFSADLILYAILVFILVIPCIFISIFGTVDAGQIFVSIICLIFYGASIISITLFFNELIPNSIASLFVNFVIQTILNSIHLIVVYVNLPEFLVNFFKQISFAWHFNSASKGIIDTRDFCWFIAITVLFLILTEFIKEKRAGKKFNLTQKSRFAAEILLIILCALNSTKIYKKVDLSKDKTFTLSKYSKNLEKNLTSPLKITYYRSSTLNQLYPQIKDVSDYLSVYAAQSKNISLQIKDPDKNQDIQTLLENYNISSQSFKTSKNNTTSYINVYSAITLEYEGKIEIISFLMGTETLEYDLDCRIKNLISDGERKVNIVIGNGMNFYSDYSYLISWLSSQGFSPNPIFIQDPNFVSILENSNGTLYIIGDSEINVEKAIAIENYILSGKGNALFNISPYSVDISKDWKITPNTKTNLVEMLENWGVQFTDNFAADLSCATLTMSSDDNNSDFNTSTHTEVLNYPLWISLLSQENCKSGATLFWPVELKLTSNNAKPLFVSSPSAYTYKALRQKNGESVIESNPFNLKNENIKDKEKSTLILGAEISGKINGLYNLGSTDKEKIYVIPDQYFLNSLMTGYIGSDYGDYRNFDLTTNLLLKLNNENELAQLQQRSFTDKTLSKITDLNHFLKMELITYIFLFLLIPILIIVSFIVVHNILRKKDEIKQN